MSTTVDERVVSIQFDNGQFEKNVSTTMNTLDKFKQKLNFSGAYKGLDDIGNAAKRVDFNPLAAGVETVGVKFNALWTIADQTLRNITNSVERTAANVVKSLTITPITTGFNEYELKMGSIQTIMGSTGESLDTVNKYLNELNEYSDKTIYSFSDMTSNIGKFTNAGVKLEDAVSAMKGISNEAAVSGANANEASRAMYNFAQALSAGYVKLIDWKSIELANMATVEFKNQLLEAGVAAGTLAKESDGMYKVLTKDANGGEFDGTISATKNFNESLSNQWMTTEVLVSTLRDYADETTEIGKKATKAATEVKTFSQMMDALKESAQSGWAMSWELIFGDFLKGKSLWTSINNVVDGMISKMSDSRNAFLYDSMTSGWDKLIDKINEAEIKTEDFEAAVKRVAKDKGGDVLKIIESYDTLEEAFASGKVSSDILREALDSLDQSGEKLELTIDRLLKKGSSGDDVKQAQTVLKKLGYDLGEFGENLDGIDGKFGSVTKSAIMAFQEANGLVADGILGPKTLEALQKASDGLNETTEESKKLSDSLSDVIDDVEKLGGRALLLKSFSNIFKNIKKIIKTVGKAWNVVFDGNAANKLYSIIEKFHAFTESLSVSDENLGKLQNSFEGLFTVIKAVRDVIVKVTSIGLKLAWSLFKPLAEIVVTCTSVMGDFIKTTYSSVSKVFKPINGFLNGFITLIGKFSKFVGSVFVGLVDTIGDSVKKWKESFEETKLFKTVSGYFEDSANVISGALSNISDRIDKVDFGKLTDKFKGVSDFFGKLAKRIGNSEFLVSAVDNVAAGVRAFFGFISNFDFSLPKIDFGSFFDSLFNGFTKLFNFLTVNNFKGIGGTIAGTIQYFANLLSIKFTTFKNNALVGIADFFVKFGHGIKVGFDIAIDVLGHIVEFLFRSKKVTLPDILEVVEKFLAISLLWKALNIVGDVSGSIGDVAKGFKQLTKSLKWRAIGDAFKAMAIALGSLTVCIYILSKMEPKKALISAGILVGLLAAMAGIVALLTLLSNKLNGEIKMASVALALVGIAGSLAIMVWALKTIDATEFKNLKKSFTIMVGAMLIMATSIGIIGKLCGGTAIKAAAAILTLLTALKLIPAILKQYAEFPWNTVKKGIPAMVTVLLGLATLCRIMTITSKDATSATGMALLIVSLVLSLKLTLDVIEELGNKDPEKMWQGIKGILAILGGITVMLVAMNLTSKGTVLESGQKSFNSFTGFATALLAVAATIWLFGKMDPKTLLQGGLAMMATLGMLTAMIAVIGKTSGGLGFKGALPMIIGIGLIIAEMYFIVKSLCGIGWEKALGSAGALSMLLISLTACIEVFSKMKVDVGQVAKGIVMMAMFSAVVGLLAFIMYKIQGIDGSNAIKQMTALSTMLLSMSACIAILSKVGAMASNALPALGVLAVFIIGLAGLLAAFGAIDWLFDGGFASLLDRAVDIMGKIGEAIGAFVGGIVKGGLEAISSTLPKLGSDLSGFMNNASDFFNGLKNIEAGDVVKAGFLTAILGALEYISALNGITNFLTIGHSLPNLGKDLGAFMNNAGPFFTTVKGLDDSTVKAVKLLSETLLVLTAANLIDGITSFLSFGKDPFDGLGEKLTSLGNGIMSFSTSIEGLTKEDADKIKVAAEAGKALTAMAATIPNEGGWAGAILGENDMTVFGKKLEAFGESLVLYAGSISSLTKKDMKNIESSAKAGKALTTMADSIPNEGGWAAAILGENDMAVFGKKLEAFGTSLVLYAKSVSDLTQSDTDSVVRSADAAKALTDLADSIPNEGGWIGAIVGENDMAEFGRKIAVFGEGLVTYAKTVSNLSDADVEAINGSKSCAEALVEVSKVIPRTDNGLWGLLTGNTDLGSFGSGMSAVAKGLKDYSNVAKDIDSSDVEAIRFTKQVIEAMSEAAESIPNAGGLVSLIAGDNNDLTGFASGMTDVAKSVGKCLEEASNISLEDIGSMLALELCIKAMSSAAKSLPNEGGLVSLITGDNSDYVGFANGMSAIAKSVSECIAMISAIPLGDVASILILEQAIKAMTRAAKSLPNEGGLVSLITGDNNDYIGFANGMAAIAKSVRDCIAIISAIPLGDIASIYMLEMAIKAMASAAKSLPNEGGLAGLIFGENSDYLGFSKGMINLAQSVTKCLMEAKNISIGDLASMLALEQAIKAMSRAAESVPTEGSVFEILTGKKMDLSTFGTGMTSLCQSILSCIGYANSFSEESIAKLGIIPMAVQALAAAANAVPTEGSVFEILTGEKMNLTTFGTGVVDLCKSILSCIGYANSFSEESIVKLGIIPAAVRALAAAVNAVPTEGSVFEILTGEKMDLNTFGTGVIGLCQSILSCIGYANCFSEDNVKQLYTIPAAVRALAAAVNAVPTEGSAFEILTGETMDLNTFGTGVVSLCQSILSCIGYANSFSEESVKQLYIIPAAVRALAAAVNAVPTEGGAFDILTGKTMDLNTFGTGVVDLCKSILSCIGYANCFNEENIEQLGMVKKAVEKLKEVYNTLDTEGGAWNKVGEAFNGTKDMGFASSMSQMIKDILSCLNSASKITEESVTKLDIVKSALEKLKEVSGSIPGDLDGSSIKSVSDGIKKLSDSLNSASKVKASSTDGIVSALNKLGDINVDSLASSIKKSSGQVKDAMDTIAKDLVKALDSKKSSFKTSGSDLMNNLITGLKSKNDAASKAAKSMVSDCASAIKEKKSSFKSAGKNLGDGLVEGIEAKYQAAYDAGYKLGQKAVQGEKDGQKSNSPSKLTIQSGKWLGEGLVIGIKKMGEKVYNAGSSMGNNAVDSISNAISRISNTIDTDIDSTPTIRPVLDLSAVSAGASEINGMLRMNPSVGVLANVNSINSMMDRNQNGANSDILSAIKDLGKSISNSGGNTYTINGVTYDDGSNVSEAVQSLIRAANIERRI